MSSPADHESPPPAAGSPLDASLLQPSRRTRLRHALRPGEPRPPAVPVPPPPGEFAPHPPKTPSAEETATADAEPRALPYRPPARGAETATPWTGAPPEPAAGSSSAGLRPARWRLPPWFFLVGLGIGGGCGWWFGQGGAAATNPGAATGREPADNPAANAGPNAPLSPYAGLPADALAAVVTDLDNAYRALRAGKFDDADASLRAAQERRPPTAAAPPGGGWPELEVERARVRFYAGDLPGADRMLDTLLRAPGTTSARADALLLRALVQGALHVPALADDLFAAAVAANPARADTLFFWGNALRAQGRPAESIPKFRAALLRNQFETMDGLIRVKLWISQLQVDAETAEAAAAIEAALTPPNVPTGYTWLGAAARALRGGRFAEAAGALRRARPLLEPVVFRVVLGDPAFKEQSWRPELAEFFR